MAIVDAVEKARAAVSIDVLQKLISQNSVAGLGEEFQDVVSYNALANAQQTAMSSFHTIVKEVVRELVPCEGEFVFKNKPLSHLQGSIWVYDDVQVNVSAGSNTISVLRNKDLGEVHGFLRTQIDVRQLSILQLLTEATLVASDFYKAVGRELVASSGKLNMVTIIGMIENCWVVLNDFLIALCLLLDQKPNDHVIFEICLKQFKLVEDYTMFPPTQIVQAAVGATS